MIIAVQTNISGRLDIWLVNARGILVDHFTRRFKYFGADRLLADLELVMTRNKCRWKTISGLIVVRGPGRFTAVRVGIVIANILSWIYGLKIRGVVSPNILTEERIAGIAMGGWAKRHIPIKPFYGQAPNISLPTSTQKVLKQVIGLRAKI